MKHKFKISFLFCFWFAGIFSFQVFSQTPETTPVIPSITLNGPRFGVTIIGNGDLSRELKSNWGVSPIITQVGWQFETRFFTLPSGHSGLIEWILLAGGIEQNVFLPSISMMFGLRGPLGVEFGFGPNVSLAGAAFAFAAGVTLNSNHINIPLNIAYVPSVGGGRVSFLIGFNTRQK